MATLLTTEPSTRPISTIPTNQAANIPAAGAKPTDALLRLPLEDGRSGRYPEPRSRWARSAKATGIRIKVATTGSTITHQRSPAKGRNCWLQPIGDSHESTPDYRLRVADCPQCIRGSDRSHAQPSAARADVVTCAITAPIAVNTMPLQATPARTRSLRATVGRLCRVRGPSRLPTGG